VLVDHRPTQRREHGGPKAAASIVMTSAYADPRAKKLAARVCAVGRRAYL